MSYIPSNTQWFVAELVMEIRVSGAEQNVLHKNLMLIRAQRPESAYEKAKRLGREAQTEFENPQGEVVRIRFRGVSRMAPVYDELEDGAELCFEEVVGASENDIRRMLPGKRKLEAFSATVGPRTGVPDYSSADVLKLLSVRTSR